MDYFTLNRRELQALCKKHGIPANLTNVSMAEALTALLNVDDNKPSDDRFQKQQVAFENTGDKSVLTDISDNPRRCTKSKKHEVAVEGKSAEEPIVLDDDEAPSALKEIHIKSATKTLKGKGGDRTEKSRSTIKQRKLLDKDVDEASAAVTPYISVNVGRGRTCKKGTNSKNPKMRTCYAPDTEDAKPLQQKYNSCENDEESGGANNGSVEEVTETRAKKVDKVEMATEESIIVSTHTEAAEPQQQNHDSCEKRKENEEPKNGSIEEAPKTRPKRGLSRKQVKSEQATEERIQVPIHTEDAKPLKQEDDLCEKGKESDEANNGSVEEVPKAKPKGRLSRKKVEEVEMATEGSSNQISTNKEDAKPLQQEHESCEEGEGSDEANNGSVGVTKTRASRRLLRKKADRVEMVTEEGIQESIDGNDHSVEVIPRTMSKARPSRIRVDKLEAAAEESIQGTNNTKDGSVEDVHEIRHMSIRNKFDAVKEAAEDNTISANHSVEEDTGTNDGSVEVGEATAESYNESVKEVPENMPKGKLSRKFFEEATEENIKWTDDVKDEEISRTKGRSSSRKRSEEAAEENIQVLDDEIKDRSPICGRSTRANALKGLDTHPLIKSSLPRRKYNGEDSVKETSRASKRTKNLGDKIVKYDPAEALVKVSAKKCANKESPKFLDGDSMEGSTRKINKEVSVFTQANQIQDSHDSADLKNGGESNPNLNCSVIKQDIISHRRAIEKATIKFHHKELDLLEADLAAEGNTGAFDGESMHDVVSPNGTELETLCSQEGRAPPSFKHMKDHADSIKEGMDISERFNVAESKTICAQQGKTPGIEDEENLETTCPAQEGKTSGIEDEESLETTCPAQEGQAPGIKDEVNQGNTIQEGVNRAESPNGAKIETMCTRKAESPNETEPETMYGQEGTTSCIKEEENQGESMQYSRNRAESPNGAKIESMCAREAERPNETEPETMCGQEGTTSGIKEEENQGESMQDSWNRAESPNGAQIETMCAREAERPNETEPETICGQEVTTSDIKEEENQGESMQDSRNRAESPNGAQIETMCAREAERPNETEPETLCGQEVTTSDIKEENQGESMQDSTDTAESPNGTETEIVYGQESESPGIKDKESQAKTAQKTVSIADIIYETEPETICAQEGKAPGINNEESQGESMHEGRSIAESPDGTESEILWGQENESPLIKVEESQGKTLHKTVSLSDSNNETEPESLSPQEDKALGIKDEESQECTEDSMSIAESPNRTEPEIVCDKESESPGNKDEESKGQTLKEPVSIAVSKKIKETENMQSSCSEASGGKDETNLFKLIRQGISISEGHDHTELGTMHLDPKVGAKLVFSYNEIERKLSTGLEDEDVSDDIKVQISEDVSEAVTSVSIGNGKADLVERLSFPSIDNDNQIDVRVVSSSIQVDNEPKSGKRLASSSAQIDSEDQMKKFTSEVVNGNNALYSACICTAEERIEDCYSHDKIGSNKSPLAKELTHYKEKHFVPDAVKDERLNDLCDESGGREEFVPWTPPKEEQHFPVPIDDDRESSLALGNNDEESELMAALRNTDVESEGMGSQQAFNSHREVEDLGLGNRNPVAVQEYEQQNTKEFDECQDKVLLDIEDTHFHEETCIQDELVQVTCVDKLREEANNNVLLIQKKVSPQLASLSVRKLKAMIKASKTAFKIDREEEDLCLGNKNLLALQEYEQQNTKEFEETLCQDKTHHFYMEDTHFHEKTCDPDDQVQVTYVNKPIQKEISPPLTSLSLRKLKTMYKETMAKKENRDSIYFQEKTCSKDRLTWGNKLKNEIKEENCANLSEPIVRKENKVGKRSALHNLSSNDLEERQKGPNKAE